MSSKKTSKGAPRKGRPRKGAPGTDVRDLPPDFVGIVDEHGKVMIDDTSYFRIQRQHEEARERFAQATAKEHATLRKLIEESENERRSLDKRLSFRLQLDAALQDYDDAIVKHIAEREMKIHTARRLLLEASTEVASIVAENLRRLLGETENDDE